MERRVVFLFARTGRGHEQAALALRDQLLTRRTDARIELLDIAELNMLLRLMPQAYTVLMRVFPWVYSLIFKATNGRRRADFLGGIVGQLIRRRLMDYLSDVPTQLVVLHPFFLASALEKLRSRHGMAWIIQVVTLDLANPHAGWWCSSADTVFAFCEETRLRATRLAPACCPILVHGFPVGQRPYGAGVTKDPETRLLVLTAGIVPMFRFLRLLRLAVDESRSLGSRLCVITSGSRAQAWVARRFGNVEAITSLDNADFIELLRRADKVLAKAGPSLLAEATQWSLPVSVINEAGDQEYGNARVYSTGQLRISAGKPDLVSELIGTRVTEGDPEVPEGATHRAMCGFSHEALVGKPIL